MISLMLTSSGGAGFSLNQCLPAYRSPLANEEVLAAAKKFRVSVIAMHIDRVARLQSMPREMHLFAHPVDDHTLARKLFCEEGVRGIYTFTSALNVDGCN